MVREESSLRLYRIVGLAALSAVIAAACCTSPRERRTRVMGHNQKVVFDLQSHAGDPIEPDAIRADLDVIDGGLASLPGDDVFRARVAAARLTLRDLRAAEWTPETRRDLFLTLTAMCNACHANYPITRSLPELGWDHKTVTTKPSAGACGSCHAEVLAEWKETLHATAWTDPIYVMSAGKPPKPECRSCHIPEPILFMDYDVSYGYRPVTRTANLDDSVGCVSCHLRADGRVAAARAVDAPCKPGKDARVRSPEFCGACHNPTHDAYYEWKSSVVSKSKGCVDCHMAPVDRPGGRKGWSHVFPGGNSPEQVKGAVKTSCAVEKGELVITVENRTGHKFPGEVPSRVFIILIKHDEREEDLRFRRPNKQEVGWKDNRLKPDEKRVVRWKIPEGTKSLRVEFWFMQSPFMRPRGWIDLGDWEMRF